MANGHGGARQGQPGKSYSNRSDLLTDRAPNPAGAAIAGTPANPTDMAAMAASSPEQTPFLADPGDPDVPLTAGIPSGPGSGAPAPAKDDLDIIKRYLPDLRAAAQRDGAPTTFKQLVRYLGGQ